MMKVLQEKGEDIPLFVASKLCKLPLVDFNNIDVCALLSKIQQTQEELLVLKATMESCNNVADILKGVANDLQVRLGRDERKQHDPFYQDIALATGSAPLPLADMLTDTDATDVKTIEDTQAKTFVQVVKAATVAPKKQLQLHTATMAQATDHRATLLTVRQTNNNTRKNGANRTRRNCSESHKVCQCLCNKIHAESGPRSAAEVSTRET